MEISLEKGEISHLSTDVLERSMNYITYRNKNVLQTCGEESSENETVNFAASRSIVCIFKKLPCNNCINEETEYLQDTNNSEDLILTNSPCCTNQESSRYFQPVEIRVYTEPRVKSVFEQNRPKELTYFREAQDIICGFNNILLREKISRISADIMEKVGIVTNHSKNPGICSDEKKEKKAPKGKCRPCGNKIGRSSVKSDRAEIEQQVINPAAETKKPGKRNSRKCDSGYKIFVTQPVRPKSAVKETTKSAQSNVCANIGKNKGGSGENDTKNTDDSKNKKGKAGSTPEAKKNPCSTCGGKIFPMPICPYSATASGERRKSETPRQCNCNKPEAPLEKTCKCIKPGETSGCLCGKCKAPCAIEKKCCKCDVCACGKKSDCSPEPKVPPCCHVPEPEPPCSCDSKPEPPSACGPKPILSCQSKPKPARSCGTKPEPTCTYVPESEPACYCEPKPEPARSCEPKPQPPRTCAEAVETLPAKQDTCSCNDSAKSKIESSKAKGDCPPKEKKCTCSKGEPEAPKLCSCGKSTIKDPEPKQSCGVVEEPPPKKDCCSCLPMPKSKAKGDCPPQKPEPTCFSVPEPEPACSCDPKPVLSCQPIPEPVHTCVPKPEPSCSCEPEPEPACSCDPEPEPACSCDPSPVPARSCEPVPEPPCPCDPPPPEPESPCSCDPLPEPAPVTWGCGKAPEPQPPGTCAAAVEIKPAKQDTCSCNGSAKSKIESSKAKGDCPPGKSKDKKCTCSKGEPEAAKLCSCGKSTKKDPKPKQSCGVVEEPSPKKICCSCQPMPKSKAEGDCPPKKPPASTCACSKMSAATLVSQAVLKIAAKKAAADTCKCNAVHVGCACVKAARKKEDPRLECEHQTRNLLEPQEDTFDVTGTVCRKKDVDSSACACADPKKEEDEDISMATLDSVVMSKKVKKFVVERTCPDACIEEKPEPCPNKPKVDACVCAPEPESDDDECVCTIEPEEKLEDCVCPPPENDECVCPPEEEIPANVCPPPEIEDCVCLPEEEIPASVCPPPENDECGCPPEEEIPAGVCPPPEIDECGCPPEEEIPAGVCPPPVIDDCGCPPEEEIPAVQCVCPPEEMEKKTEDEACSCPFKLNINDIQSLTLALDKYITKSVKI